ncbi:uncharacterized protein LOC132736355 [Ruditapes philippinarum]|uniref:uncharacterized protein LOC132736355 n=1 Tax=Ruditapes philippinarum TaxID=129788 RepID=UPI00295B4E74|nr:uncharacterized protein LOC132736355 [Ruditapes philippinarum]
MNRLSNKVYGDPELSSLAASLPEVALSSKACNTSKKYQRSYNSWSKWARQHGLVVFPANDVDFSLYLVSLIQSCNSPSTVDEAFYGMKWANDLAGNLNNPCSSFLVKSVREAAHRILGHRVSRKEPVTPEILFKGTSPLSYTRARELILDMFEHIGLDKSKFGLHSLRSGGASAAANAGVSDRLFKRHGRWKSEKGKDSYVKDDIDKRLLYLLSEIEQEPSLEFLPLSLRKEYLLDAGNQNTCQMPGTRILVRCREPEYLLDTGNQNNKNPKRSDP